MNKRRPGPKFTMDKPKKYKQVIVAKAVEPNTGRDIKKGI
jgi:hypothetical protein